MSDLTITRTVERWARQHRSHRLYEAWAWAGAVVVVLVAVMLVVMVWVPSASAVLLLAPLAIGGVALFVWRYTRHRAGPDEIASMVDEEAGTSGILRTALAVEGGRASGGDEPCAVVLANGNALLPQVEHIAAPPFEVPLVPAIGAAVALVLAVLLVVPVWLFAPMPEASGPEQFVEDGVAFDEARRLALQEASDELGHLAAEPGVTPEARAALLQAREHMRAAMQAGPDAQQAASELDRARAALQKAQIGPLRSAEALWSSKPEQLARGLDAALERNDTAAARRVGEELLRRVDGGVPDGEVRQLGRALVDGVKNESRAGARARDAGEALQAGDRTDAQAALSELMAALGEPARYEGGPEALTTAEAAIERARDQSLARLDQAERRARGEGGGDPQGGGDRPDQPGEGKTPAPLEIPDKGGQGDGGGGTAQGGSEDLREGGTPGASEDPGEVGVDGERPEGDRSVGPDGDPTRAVAGDGGVSDGQTPQDQEAGQGSGPAPTDGGAPSQSDSGGPPSLVAAPGPLAAGAGGTGRGTDAELDVPLLDLDPSTIEREWVQSQWNGAGEAMEGVVTDADAGGRSGLAWGAVHARYSAIAESASRRGAVPLTRRAYVRRYFEAIRPEEPVENE